MILSIKTDRSGQTVQTQIGAAWSGSTLSAILYLLSNYYIVKPDSIVKNKIPWHFPDFSRQQEFKFLWQFSTICRAHYFTE